MNIEKEKDGIKITMDLQEATALKKLTGAVAPGVCRQKYGMTQKQANVIYDVYDKLDDYFEALT